MPSWTESSIACHVQSTSNAIVDWILHCMSRSINPFSYQRFSSPHLLVQQFLFLHTNQCVCILIYYSFEHKWICELKTHFPNHCFFIQKNNEVLIKVYLIRSTELSKKEKSQMIPSWTESSIACKNVTFNQSFFLS